MALLPGLADWSRRLAAIRVIDVGTLATAMVVVVQHRELGAVDRAQVVDWHAQHHRHHDIDLRLSITTILRPTQRRICCPLRANLTLVITLQNRLISHKRLIPTLRPQVGVGVREAVETKYAQSDARRQLVLWGKHEEAVEVVCVNVASA